MALVCMVAASESVEAVFMASSSSVSTPSEGMGETSCIMGGVKTQLWARRGCHWALRQNEKQRRERKTLKSALMMARTSLSHIVGVRIALRIVTIRLMLRQFDEISQMLPCGIYRQKSGA